MDASVKSAVAMGAILTLAQLGALVMIAAVLDAEDAAFENPDDPMIPIYYLLAIVLFTFLVLYTVKRRREDIVRLVFLGAVSFTIFYVLLMVLLLTGSDLVALGGSLVLTAALTYYLVKRPEWYVIDSAGVLVAVGVIGIFGISLSILPVMILLIALAVYDAISVYGTKHMVALADGVTEMRLPILLVIPKKKGYSYLRQKPLRQQLEEGSEREAMFMGLGDVIIPGVLAGAAFNFLPHSHFMGVPGNLLVALCTILGALVGFAVLMRYVMRGNPQAGLPLLNGGAIAGYVVSYLIVFRDISLGMTLPW